MLTPLTASAETWLRTHIGPDASWSGERLAVEMRYFPALADAAMAAGFTFERDALLS